MGSDAEGTHRMDVFPDSVRSRIVLRMVVPDGPDRPVRADLNYEPTDPYAVRIAFHTGGTDVVEWTFARSLLSDGVTHFVGDGDVQVWPADDAGSDSDSTDCGGVCLALSSPTGHALFKAQPPSIVSFLSRTYEVVPTGAESGFVDLDGELAALLEG